MATSPAVPDQRTLIELKAVDAAYPLVGAPVLSPAMPLSRAIACDANVCGAAVEDALLTRLGLKLGDPVRVGNGNFAIRAVLVSEPDRVAGGFVLGPRVMVSQEGLQRSGLVTPGSLITWSYRVAFTGKATIEDFRKDLLQAWPQSAWEISDRNNAIPNVTQFIDQATMFLGLVGLTALVVAGIGAGQAVEAFLKGKRTTIAILKSLGAETGLIFRIYLVEIVAVSALGLFAGGIAGALFPLRDGTFLRRPDSGACALRALCRTAAARHRLRAFVGRRICAAASGARLRHRPGRIVPRSGGAVAHSRAVGAFHAAAAAAFAAIALLSMLVSPSPLFNLAFLAGAAVVLVALRARRRRSESGTRPRENVEVANHPAGDFQPDTSRNPSRGHDGGARFGTDAARGRRTDAGQHGSRSAGSTACARAKLLLYRHSAESDRAIHQTRHWFSGDRVISMPLRCCAAAS